MHLMTIKILLWPVNLIVGVELTIHSFFFLLHVSFSYETTCHEDARNGIFTGAQKRRSVDWPEIPLGFEEWSPKKRRKGKEKK